MNLELDTIEGIYSAFSDQWSNVIFKMAKKVDWVSLYKLCVTEDSKGKVEDIGWAEIKYSSEQID